MLKNKKIICSINEYIQNAPKGTQIILKKIRQTVQQAAPKAVESISYGMPAFKLGGKVLVFFAVWQHHIGFYATPSGNKAFQKEISKYKISKGAIQFLLEEAIPYSLIEKIVLFRVKENQKTNMQNTKPSKRTLTTCSREHAFYKSSDRPTCPKCWPGRYKKNIKK